MQTYLDGEIRRTLAQVAEADPYRSAILAGARDDGEALLKLEEDLCRAFPQVGHVFLADGLAPGFGEWALFMRRCAAIVREPVPDAAAGARPLRIALTRTTTGMLAGARLGPAIERAFTETLAAHSVLYVDIAPGGLIVVGRLQVRALIAEMSSAEEVPALTTVLTPPGSERGCRVTYLMGEPDPRRRLWSSDRARFDPERALQGTGVGLDAVLQAAEDLLRLAVVHAATTQESKSELPYAPPGDPRRHGHRGRRAAKKWSLFRIQRLTPPRDTRGRRMPGRDGEGADLTVRQSVQGHFKLQAHGPGRQLRRLIYVAPYERGPSDGRRRGDLHRPGAAAPPRGADQPGAAA